MATLEDVRTLATKMEEEYGSTGECDFTVEINDCSVYSIWLDRSARFVLNDAQAIEEWGKQNVAKYIREAIKYLNVA